MDTIEYFIQREDEIRLAKGLSPLNLDERRKAREILSSLMNKAKPGNWAWRALEEKWGVDGDYHPYDHADAPPEYEYDY